MTTMRDIPKDSTHFLQYYSEGFEYFKYSSDTELYEWDFPDWVKYRQRNGLALPINQHPNFPGNERINTHVDGINLDVLESKALAANKGPWRLHFHNKPLSHKNTWNVCTDEFFGEYICSTSYVPESAGDTQEKSNCEYIAAANPAVMLELIRELRELRVKHGTDIKSDT